MRAPFLTLGLSALLTIGVVLGFVGLRTQRAAAQTVGPTSAEYPSFNIAYSVPESG